MTISTGFVIGNGTSRRGFDLEKLNGRGVTVGCNTIYEHYCPDYVVAIDKEGVDLINDLPPHDWKFITRRYHKREWHLFSGEEAVHKFRTINYGHQHNSGLLATWFLSHHLRLDTVYMVGMDFFRQVPGEDNDLYSGNYPHGEGFRSSFEMVFKEAPQTEFVRLGKVENIDRDFYNDFKGLKTQEYNEVF